MDAPHSDISFDLSSSVRSQRTERVPITSSWYYLRPTVLPFKSHCDDPFIHIGRSQKYCSLYNRGTDLCCWNARMCVIPGAPLQLTFEPVFVPSDDMFYARIAADDEESLQYSTAIHSNDRDTHHQNEGGGAAAFTVPAFHFPDLPDPLSKKRAVAPAAAKIDVDFALPAADTRLKRPKSAKGITTTVVTFDAA
jgi:hypothetical protein